MKKIVCFFSALLLLMVGQVAFAQRVEVMGKVSDSKTGEPIPFASIRLVGTMTGASAGADGIYSIRIPSREDAVFEVSFLGYKSVVVEVKGRAVVDVELDPDALSLKETIVVAFGTTTKEAFTGSASVLDSETLSNHITTNASNALIGTTPGLQIKGSSGAPGAGQGSINIRGFASMYADTDPLIIVDGAPYDGSLANISQNDIESITVLKDAASAALYGARGAAGVILVTTKSGENKKAQVKVDMRWGANTRSVQDYSTITDPGQYYETAYRGWMNYYFYGYGYDFDKAYSLSNAAISKALRYIIYTVPDGENLIERNGKLNPNATLGRAYTYGGG